MVARACPRRLNAPKDGKREIMDIFLSSKPLVKPKAATKTACLIPAVAPLSIFINSHKTALRLLRSAVLAE
jgi:hypothetical protein